MTLNTELPNDHKIHRLHQHQHHHQHLHYHVHHLLHHHQHIHDQMAQNHIHSLKSLHEHNHDHTKQVLPFRKSHNHIVSRPHERNQQLSTRARHVSKYGQRTQIQFFLTAAFIYILSPIDLIPEAIFGIFGILDDLLFLFMCLLCVAVILLYPIFREMQRTIFDKLGLKEGPAITNKGF